MLLHSGAQYNAKIEYCVNHVRYLFLSFSVWRTFTELVAVDLMVMTTKKIEQFSNEFF